MGRRGKRRRIEDRELSPTSAGHPRHEDEDEAEELRGGETIFDEKLWLQIRSKLRPSGRDDIDGASKGSIVSLAGNRVERSDVS